MTPPPTADLNCPLARTQTPRTARSKPVLRVAVSGSCFTHSPSQSLQGTAWYYPPAFLLFLPLLVLNALPAQPAHSTFISPWLSITATPTQSISLPAAPALSTPLPGSCTAFLPSTLKPPSPHRASALLLQHSAQCFHVCLSPSAVLPPKYSHDGLH